jgi:hypothetical protein
LYFSADSPSAGFTLHFSFTLQSIALAQYKVYVSCTMPNNENSYFAKNKSEWSNQNTALQWVLTQRLPKAMV